jgi:predicted Rossmann fold nucleotide-binding protein DprA/Smf involved in DNA uptake
MERQAVPGTAAREAKVTDPRDLQAALAWLAVPHVGERTLLALIDHAREARASLTDLWESPPDDLARLVTLHPRALEALRGSRDAYWERAGIDLNEAHLRGAELLLAGDPEYPAQLWPLSGKQVRRWPFVFAFGALGLLEERGVVIGNSKEVSAQGLAVPSPGATCRW